VRSPHAEQYVWPQVVWRRIKSFGGGLFTWKRWIFRELLSTEHGDLKFARVRTQLVKLNLIATKRHEKAQKEFLQKETKITKKGRN
jgi:hypothetical protein